MRVDDRWYTVSVVWLEWQRVEIAAGAGVLVRREVVLCGGSGFGVWMGVWCVTEAIRTRDLCLQPS